MRCCNLKQTKRKDMVTLQYRKAALDDIEEICSLISHAIDEMIEHGILQWDELYPAREDT